MECDQRERERKITYLVDPLLLPCQMQNNAWSWQFTYTSAVIRMFDFQVLTTLSNFLHDSNTEPEASKNEDQQHYSRGIHKWRHPLWGEEGSAKGYVTP